MSTALSLQFAAAVTDRVAEVGVIAVRLVGLPNGVLVGGNVAVTNLGVVSDGVGVEMETQAARLSVTTETVNNKFLMF